MSHTCHDYRVGVTRGLRDYVHALDMLHAAPISANDQSFKLRFHQILRSPGNWQPLDGGIDRNSVVAELFVSRANGTENWVLLADPSRHVVPAPDFGYTFDTTRMQHTGKLLTTPLRPDVDFWEQLVGATRFWGGLLFPGRTWLTVGISGTAKCLLPLTAEATLTLKLVSSRAGLNTIQFTTSDGKEGRILAAPRLGIFV